MIVCNSKVNSGASLEHFGVTFGSSWVYEGGFGSLLGSLGHHIMQMMCICAGLVGPKSENVHAISATTGVLGVHMRAKGE